MPKPTSNSVLVTDLPPNRVNVAASMNRVRSVYGIKRSRQLWDMARLALRPGRIHPTEYMTLGLSNPSLDWSEKLTFRGRRAVEDLTSSLFAGDLSSAGWLLKDKLLTNKLLGALGAANPDNSAGGIPVPPL
ncbi:hypothetical protein [Aliiroseovarius subalbicans]|uniref:hypothetical protein n=1 Tax=Aliiroseovarius subalbicans TaxID=2925840 RepID=UPI001F59047D|nr:hypothetical protein [Aliiroseovarius subalbicans]MCI2398944.1 hypothetical protein [Aliiroseovarius subalbicans]